MDEITAVAVAIFGAMIRADSVPGHPIKDAEGRYIRDKAGNPILETPAQQIARRWAKTPEPNKQQFLTEARAAIAALDAVRSAR